MWQPLVKGLDVGHVCVECVFLGAICEQLDVGIAGKSSGVPQCVLPGDALDSDDGCGHGTACHTQGILFQHLRWSQQHHRACACYCLGPVGGKEQQLLFPLPSFHQLLLLPARRRRHSLSFVPTIVRSKFITPNLIKYCN